MKGSAPKLWRTPGEALCFLWYRISYGSALERVDPSKQPASIQRDVGMYADDHGDLRAGILGIVEYNTGDPQPHAV